MKINLPSKILQNRKLEFACLLLFVLAMVALDKPLISPAQAMMANQQVSIPSQFIGEWVKVGKGPYGFLANFRAVWCKLIIRSDGTISEIGLPNFTDECGNSSEPSPSVDCPKSDPEYLCSILTTNDTIRLHSASPGSFLSDATLTMVDEDTLRYQSRLEVYWTNRPTRFEDYSLVFHRVTPRVLKPCPPGLGPGGIKPGDYPPQDLTQAQRQWLFEVFGNKGIASDGYGGERCMTDKPSSQPKPALGCATTELGPGGIKPGSYDPTKLSGEQRQWLFEIFGHPGYASDGYGGEVCGEAKQQQGSSMPQPPLGMKLAPDYVSLSDENKRVFAKLKWPESTLPVPVYVDASVPKEWYGSIESAISELNKRLPSKLLEFKRLRQLGQIGNEIYIDVNDYPRDSGSNAAARTCFYDPKAKELICDQKKLQPMDGTIQGARIDLIPDDLLAGFLTSYWSVDPNAHCTDFSGVTFHCPKYVQTYVTHELLHALGWSFLHSGNPEDIMYGEEGATQRKVLTNTDIGPILQKYFPVR